MEPVWILAALCNGFVVVNWLPPNRKSPLAPVLAHSNARCGQRTRAR
jgi:hypothetical protein